MKWPLLFCVIALLAFTGLIVAKLYKPVYFNSTSGIKWTDDTINPSETVAAIQLAVTLPGGDPRIQDESCIQKLILIPAGESIILKPLMAGLSPGAYLVYTRVSSLTGSNPGPWSIPFQVVVDLNPPASPEKIERK